MAVMLPTKMRGPREQTDGSDIFIRNFGPDDVELPSAPLPSMQQTRFFAQQTYEAGFQNKSQRKFYNHSKNLDGFCLLECCGVEFPDQAITCDASNINAVNVLSEDLSFFTKLSYLDLSRNKIPNITCLSGLLELNDLRLPCNNIKNMGPLLPSPSSTFLKLLSLDLSYNSFNSMKEISLLGSHIPNLQYLDLTCNNIKKLPSPKYMSCFINLTKLILERNGITDNNGNNNEQEQNNNYDNYKNNEDDIYGDNTSTFFECCSAIPNLEDLQLGYNYLTYIPKEISLSYETTQNDQNNVKLNLNRNNKKKEDDEDDIGGKITQYLHKRKGPFCKLSILGLAFNYIESEYSLYPLSKLPHLHLLTLYGNPLLGPTLEDPTGQSLADFALEVYNYRDGISTIAMDILTEVPRKKPYASLSGSSNNGSGGHKGDIAAWRSKYKSQPIQVEKGQPRLPSGYEFKTMGKDVLKKIAEKHKQSEKNNNQINKKINSSSSSSSVSSSVNQTNSKTSSSLLIMDNGGGGGGGDPTGTFLTGIDPFEEIPDLRPTSTILNPNIIIGGSSQFQSPNSKNNNNSNHSNINSNPKNDVMPPTIFSRNVDHNIPSDPAKLRGALSSLRHVLNHPLSGGTNLSSDEAYLLKKNSHKKNSSHSSSSSSNNQVMIKRGGNQFNNAGKSIIKDAPDNRINRSTNSTRVKQKMPIPSSSSSSSLNGSVGVGAPVNIGLKQNSYMAPPLPPELGLGVMGQGRGVRETHSFQAMVQRKEAAASNFDAIEAELDAMMEAKN